MSTYAIAELDAAGGWLGISPLPGRGGAYSDDLATLFAWRPSMVISLTPLSEMSAKGASTLGADLARAGIEWRHFPVEDFGVPGEAVGSEWSDLSRDAHHLLHQGARVLAHCYGGCGRSGMVLLRLMVDAGEVPTAALARLREVRPCAVETGAQLMWAGVGKPG